MTAVTITQGGNMAEEDKARDMRARRAAARQGLRLERSRVRDPRAIGYGTYRLVDASTNNIRAGMPPTGYGLTLDDVERILDEALTK
jgi:hypothetical protein